VAQTPTGVDRRLNVKIPPEVGVQLEALAARNRRNLSGQVCWLIEQAHQQLQQEAGE
jgi:hypothetical protein